MQRRQFMRASSLGAAAPWLGGGMLSIPGLQVASVEPRYRLAVKLGMVSEGKTVLEKFQLLRELGFDGVEVSRPAKTPVAEIVAASKATGLPVHGVVDSDHWRHPFSDPSEKVRAKARAALKTALEDAAALSADTVLVVPAIVNGSVSYADAYRRSQEEIRKLVPLAEKLGVRIAFENVWNNFLLSPLEAARYCDEFESPSVGFYFDVGNVVRYGWPEHWIEALGPRLFKLDIKEYSRKKQNDEGLWKGFGVKIGDGDCGWERVCRALEKINYRGWATAEVGGGKRERLVDIRDRMRRALVSDPK